MQLPLMGLSWCYSSVRVYRRTSRGRASQSSACSAEMASKDVHGLMSAVARQQRRPSKRSTVLSDHTCDSTSHQPRGAQYKVAVCPQPRVLGRVTRRRGAGLRTSAMEW